MVFEVFISVILSIPLPGDSLHLMLMRSEMRLAAASMAQKDTASPIDAVHYDIRVDVNIDARQISGWTTGYYAVRDTIDTLSVHFRGFSIDSLKLNGQTSTYARTDTTIEVALTQTAVPGDTLELDVWYHGTPPSSSAGFNGGLKVTRSRAFVAFDIDGARSWFPCHDIPSDKVTVDQFITVPTSYTVIANGNLISVDTANSKVTYHWSEQYPIATYLIVFSAYNNYAHVVDTAMVDGHPVPIHGWIARWDSVDRTRRLQNVADMVEFFSQIYTPYPFLEEKYANVDVPLGYAMENQTNTFIDMGIYWGSNWDWVLAHELSHQWWGDCVTLATWPDVWLNEGFATYSEAMNAYRTGGMAEYFAYMQSIQRRYLTSAPYPPYPIYYPEANIWQLYSVVTYQKAASVLHMLRHIVGDSAFFQILRGRVERHAYGSETTEEFKQLCEDVSGMDLDWFFDEWIYSPGHPQYRWDYTVEPDGDSALVIVSVYQVQSHSYGVPTFRMPIDFRIDFPSGDTMWVTVVDSLDFQQFRFWVPQYPSSVQFDPVGWILGTKQFTGVKEEGKAAKFPFSIKSTVVSNMLQVEFPSPLDSPVDVMLADVSGRVVRSFSGLTGSRTVTLDIRSMKNGVYMLIVRKNGRIIGRSKILIIK